MREVHGLKGRVGTKVKAALVAVVAVFAMSALGASPAAADQQLKLSFDQGEIAVLPELLGPIVANPPAGQPVRVEGNLASDGSFSAEKTGFTFPTQTIPLPADDPMIASVLGDHVDIILEASGPFTGSFAQDTGAFNTNMPLQLTLKFAPPPPAVLACTLPLNLAVNTTGTLTFPGAGAGGSDLVFQASPFAPPAGTGAIYGSWPAVKFTDVKDGPGMDPAGSQCAGLLGLLPSFITGWPAGLDGIEGQIWLGGAASVIGGPDATPARITKVKSARKAKVKRGKKVKVAVKVTNKGGKAFKGKLTAKSSNKQVKAKAVKLNVKPGKTQTVKVTVKAGKKAKGKAKITFAAGGRKSVTTVTIRK